MAVDLLKEFEQNQARQPIDLLKEFEQDQPGLAEQALGLASKIPGPIGAAIKSGVPEAVANIASGAVAQPVAGLAGLAVAPFAGTEKAAETIKGVEEALTVAPVTEAGKERLGEVGEALAPVGRVLTASEKFLGENTLRLTGSPALAAIAHALPTGAIEAIGFKGAGRVAKAGVTPSKRQVKKAVVESAPEIEQIKSAVSAVYKEIDDSGVTVKSDPIEGLVKNITAKTKKAGLDADVTPRAAGAIKRLQSELGNAKTLSEIDTLRKVAQGVANQTDRTEKALGNIMITEIDDFLDNLKSTDLEGGTESAAKVGKKFKAARKLWGRARRAEVIQEALTTGESRAAGAEAGIRNELNRILNNKKLSKFFPEDEKAVMRAVVDGDFAQNITRAIGKFGISIDRSPNVIGSIISGAGGGSIISGVGSSITAPALGIVAVGSVSKEIAKRLTRGKARFVESVTRAGSDGERIARAYFTAVPKAKRSAEELSDLLTDPKVNLDELENVASKTVQKALDIAKGKRALNLGAAASTGALVAQTPPDNQ